MVDACHSPKVLVDGVPQPDPARRLSGHPADRAMPAIPAGLSDPSGWVAVTNADGTVWAGPWGVSYSINLTPDPSGLGSWRMRSSATASRARSASTSAPSTGVSGRSTSSSSPP